MCRRRGKNFIWGHQMHSVWDTADCPHPVRDSDFGEKLSLHSRAFSSSHSTRPLLVPHLYASIHSTFFVAPTRGVFSSASTNPSIVTRVAGMRSSPSAAIFASRRNILSLGDSVVFAGAPPSSRVASTAFSSAAFASAVHRVSQNPFERIFLNIAAPVGTHTGFRAMPPYVINAPSRERRQRVGAGRATHAVESQDERWKRGDGFPGVGSSNRGGVVGEDQGGAHRAEGVGVGVPIVSRARSATTSTRHRAHQNAARLTADVAAFKITACAPAVEGSRSRSTSDTPWVGSR